MADEEMRNTNVNPPRAVLRFVIYVVLGIILLIVSPFLVSMGANEAIRFDLMREMRGYAHPDGSYHIRNVTYVGNLSNSNGCDVFVADIRSGYSSADDLYTYYAPIIRESSMNEEPPLRDTRILIWNDQDDNVFLENWLSDLYYKVTDIATEYTDIYVVLSSRTEYPPNFDIRCH